MRAIGIFVTLAAMAALPACDTARESTQRLRQADTCDVPTDDQKDALANRDDELANEPSVEDIRFRMALGSVYDAQRAGQAGTATNMNRLTKYFLGDPRFQGGTDVDVRCLAVPDPDGHHGGQMTYLTIFVMRLPLPTNDGVTPRYGFAIFTAMRKASDAIYTQMPSDAFQPQNVPGLGNFPIPKRYMGFTSPGGYDELSGWPAGMLPSTYLAPPGGHTASTAAAAVMDIMAQPTVIQNAYNYENQFTVIPTLVAGLTPAGWFYPLAILGMGPTLANFCEGTPGFNDFLALGGLALGPLDRVSRRLAMVVAGGLATASALRTFVTAYQGVAQMDDALRRIDAGQPVTEAQAQLISQLAMDTFSTVLLGMAFHHFKANPSVTLKPGAPALRSQPCAPDKPTPPLVAEAIKWTTGGLGIADLAEVVAAGELTPIRFRTILRGALNELDPASSHMPEALKNAGEVGAARQFVKDALVRLEGTP